LLKIFKFYLRVISDALAISPPAGSPPTAAPLDILAGARVDLELALLNLIEKRADPSWWRRTRAAAR